MKDGNPGPLRGYKIIEFAGLGPAPFCAMLLADYGAQVLRIERPAQEGAVALGGTPADPMQRGRKCVAVNLKHPEGLALVLKLLDQADALVEGFRPGVMERLGLGPEHCLARTPRLVYGRVTGWGQAGPLADAAGHDANYIALAGVLAHIGNAGGAPVLPLNLIGDFGGGGMLVAVGILTALLERHSSGEGQIVDAAMIDGAALLMSMLWGWKSSGLWGNQRGLNLLDGGAPFYAVYETRDGAYISIAALEPKFYNELLGLLGLDSEALPPQMDQAHWPALRRRFEEIFRKKSRDQWCELLEGTDACFAPVLSMEEAVKHRHHQSRQGLISIGGITQPAPAPRFSRSKPSLPEPGSRDPGILAEWGLDAEDLTTLIKAGVVA